VATIVASGPSEEKGDRPADLKGIVQATASTLIKDGQDRTFSSSSQARGRGRKARACRGSPWLYRVSPKLPKRLGQALRAGAFSIEMVGQGHCERISFGTARKKE